MEVPVRGTFSNPIIAYVRRRAATYIPPPVRLLSSGRGCSGRLSRRVLGMAANGGTTDTQLPEDVSSSDDHGVATPAAPGVDDADRAALRRASSRISRGSLPRDKHDSHSGSCTVDLCVIELDDVYFTDPKQDD